MHQPVFHPICEPMVHWLAHCICVLDGMDGYQVREPPINLREYTPCLLPPRVSVLRPRNALALEVPFCERKPKKQKYSPRQHVHVLGTVHLLSPPLPLRRRRLLAGAGVFCPNSGARLFLLRRLLRGPHLRHRRVSPAERRRRPVLLRARVLVRRVSPAVHGRRRRI